MGTNSSGEELIVKTRKPYAITKQRERWTEEEHSRLLEALKLYGRAWQRIEEHIGTKTAVQIRSHAQKFFTKLEKESLTKGGLPRHAHDINIPPPRPKRKPRNPYPRKSSIGAPNSSLGDKDGKPVTSVSSLCPSRQVLDLENEPPLEEPPGTETFQRMKETSEDGNCSEVLNIFQEAPCTFISSARKTSVSIPDVLTKPFTSRECVPLMKEGNGPISTDGTSLTAESKVNQKLGKTDAGNTDLDISRCEELNLENCSHPMHENVVSGKGTNEAKQQEKLDSVLIETQAALTFPRNVPVHVVDGSIEKCAHTSCSDVTNPVSLSHQSGAHGNPDPFPVPPISPTTAQYANSGRSSIHPPFPILHPPFTLFCNNQDSHQSFLNISSTFSNLILSTLLQNPSVHAAATMAASFWPCADDSLADAPVGGFSVRHTGQSPSLAAIVAATVAAASAWWVSHGLLPYCPPPHTSFTFPPAATTGIPTAGAMQAPEDNKEITNGVPQYPSWEDQCLLDPESSTALKTQAPATKSPLSPSSNLEESGGARSHAAELKASSHVQMQIPYTGIPDTDKGKARKPLDRSSCGSNTTSSSEVETDVLEKQTEGKEESKEAELSHPAGEPINRRCRNTGNYGDSWKEVSEEGRLAFQALFSREVLPQSFSPPRDLRNKAHPQNSNEEENKKDEDAIEFDLDKRTWVTSLDNPHCIEMDVSLTSDNTDKGLLTNVLTGHSKLKGRQTGFKPYKRCSMEVNESRAVNNSDPSEEKGTKRLRLEGEAST